MDVRRGIFPFKFIQRHRRGEIVQALDASSPALGYGSVYWQGHFHAANRSADLTTGTLKAYKRTGSSFPVVASITDTKFGPTGYGLFVTKDRLIVPPTFYTGTSGQDMKVFSFNGTNAYSLVGTMASINGEVIATNDDYVFTLANNGTLYGNSLKITAPVALTALGNVNLITLNGYPSTHVVYDAVATLLDNYLVIKYEIMNAEGYDIGYKMDAFTFNGTAFTRVKTTNFDTEPSAANFAMSKMVPYKDGFIISKGEDSGAALFRYYTFNGTNFVLQGSMSKIFTQSMVAAGDILYVFGSTRTGSFNEIAERVITSYYFDSGEFHPIDQHLLVGGVQPSAVAVGLTQNHYQHATDGEYVHLEGRFLNTSNRACPAGNACTTPYAGTTKSGNTIAAYNPDSTNPGTGLDVCTYEVRTCTNGTLSGSLQAASCGRRLLGLNLGGRKVICTHYHKKGMLSDDLYAAELVYAEMVNPKVMVGYHKWAIPAVRWLEDNEWIDPIIAPLVRGWSREVSYRIGMTDEGSWLGKLVLGIGEPVSILVANLMVDENSPEDASLIASAANALSEKEFAMSRTETLASAPQCIPYHPSF